MLKYVIRIVKFGIILNCLILFLLYSMTEAIYLPTFHLDGAFQTASGLFRLNSGQFPGKDFLPYLGIGPIFILFPIFKILGANLSASVISSQFVTLILGVLHVSLIFHFIWRPKLFSTSVTAGAIFFMVLKSSINFEFILPEWSTFYFSAGNSLRPIRAGAPYLLVMSYYFIGIKHGKRKYVLSGILTALILLWSNDYAISSALIFTLFILGELFCSHTLNVRNSLTYFFSVSVGGIVFLSLATQGNPLALIKYNFLDVAKDQWWFFPPYREELRIFSLKQLGELVSKESQLSLVVLIFVGIMAIKTRLIEHVLVFMIGLILFAGGVVASIGGHYDRGYFWAFFFWGGVTFIATFFRFTWLSTNKFFQQIIFEKVFLKILLIISLGASLLATFKAWNTFQCGLSGAKNNSNYFYVPELGGYLGKEWSDYISLIRKTETSQVIEEYWGLWSATSKINSAWPVDSVLSALGNKREIAKQKLQDAKIIISTKCGLEAKPITLAVHSWSFSQNYWFYEKLIKFWKPYYFSPTTIVWVKDNNVKYTESIDCKIDNKNKLLVLNAPRTGFYELEMKYSLFGYGRCILMVKNNISSISDSRGYVSLNPKGCIAKFPVYFSRSGLNFLDFNVIGTSKYDLELLGCEAHLISSTGYGIFRVPRPEGEDFFITDSNWVHGVARNGGGFFVPNIEEFTSKYKSGRQVLFPSGDVRKIIRTELNQNYLVVYLDGDPIIPEKVGVPTLFVVIDDTKDNSATMK